VPHLPLRGLLAPQRQRPNQKVHPWLDLRIEGVSCESMDASPLNPKTAPQPDDVLGGLSFEEYFKGKAAQFIANGTYFCCFPPPPNPGRTRLRECADDDEL
jgi:hypothetical protein